MTTTDWQTKLEESQRQSAEDSRAFREDLRELFSKLRQAVAEAEIDIETETGRDVAPKDEHQDEEYAASWDYEMENEIEVSNATEMLLEQAKHEIKVTETETEPDKALLKGRGVSDTAEICNAQTPVLRSNPDEAGNFHVETSSTGIVINKTSPEENVKRSATMEVRKLELSTEVKFGVISFNFPFIVDFDFVRPPAMPPEKKWKWEELLRNEKRVFDVIIVRSSNRIGPLVKNEVRRVEVVDAELGEVSKVKDDGWTGIREILMPSYEAESVTANLVKVWIKLKVAGDYEVSSWLF